jgi:MFS family permease
MAHRIGALCRVYAFGAAWMGVIVMPFYVPFLAARGLTISDVLSLQGIYAVAMLLFEIPTGYVCDVLGRRRTILIGAVANLAGFIAFAMAHGFAAYAVVQLVLAAGFSLVSGADIALIYDILDVENADRTARRKAISNYMIAGVLGEASLGLLGSALATWSLTAVGVATAAEAALPLLIAATLPGGGNRPSAVKIADVPPAVRELFLRPGLGLLFANMTVWGLSTFIALWLLQPYWHEQGVGIRWFGPLWAGTLVTVAITAKLAHQLTARIGQRGALLIVTMAPVAGYAGMAWWGGTPGIVAGFLFYISRGLNSVNLTEAFNHQVPSRLRATFNSMNSGAFRLSFAVAGPVVGIAVKEHGLNWSLALLAVAFLLAFVLIGIPLLRRPAAL